MLYKIASFLLLTVFFNTALAQNKPILSFNAGGDFKIVQFTDTHIDIPGNKNRDVFEIVRGIILEERPDLVVLTGDVVTQDDPIQAYQLFEDLFAEFSIPWVVAFGNHDSQHNASRVEIANFLAEFPHCLNADKEETYGNSNFVLTIAGEESKEEALIYIMDSNSNSTLQPQVGGYGWFDFSQVQWYREKSKGFTEVNRGNPLPALAFFHIPLPEYAQAWSNETNPAIGVKNEEECSPEINTGMFAAMLEAGDVMGTFVGHDHINDYIGVHHGIALAYGRVTKMMKNLEEDPLAGGRVIVIKEGKREFETWIRDMNGLKELEVKWPNSFVN
ncbi:Calcineurin-like phosphoesterase [Algoriphagus locisalis]|uniref:Calcineurin-like phosphoesterase n=1 Tax=Algoriphagus locisalis TaxID=305507 RepID=A0A1I6XHA3_9BACT|nr:metallophosphoesterase family protein [Algoriphagus locisalis]SFT37234.1 Calcineurin-like phosphoesterase [Algoriphagus locisalis]